LIHPGALVAVDGTSGVVQVEERIRPADSGGSEARSRKRPPTSSRSNELEDLPRHAGRARHPHRRQRRTPQRPPARVSGAPKGTGLYRSEFLLAAPAPRASDEDCAGTPCTSRLLEAMGGGRVTCGPST
jgi:hypothetical protein